MQAQKITFYKVLTRSGLKRNIKQFLFACMQLNTPRAVADLGHFAGLNPLLMLSYSIILLQLGLIVMPPRTSA